MEITSMIKIKMISIYENEGEFFIRPGTQDEAIIKSLWKTNSYFSLGYIPQENDIIIDIGANIGAFTIEAALFGAEVWSYEPWPETFEMLKKNIILNKVEKKVHAYMQGVYTRRTKMKMWESLRGHGGNNLYKNNCNPEKYLIVDLIPINGLLECFEKINFLKIDCEGGERDIIPIACLKNVDAIMLEWHKLEDKAKILRHLKAQGFNITYVETYPDNLGIIKARR